MERRRSTQYDIDGKSQLDPSLLHGWPSSPATLRDSSLSTWQRFSLSASLVFIPAAFIVLGVSLVYLHQQPESELGSRVLEAANVAATIWPIAFAAVLGTSLRSVALYSCERGTTLGTLEILLGSVTMTNTLKLLFWVRLVSFWTPILVFSWILSPLGGQSVLRAVALNADTISSDFSIISYPASNFTAKFDMLPTLYALPFGMRTVSSAAFSSSASRLMLANGSSPNFNDSLEQVGGPDQALRLAQQDIWGNVRIPFVHMLDGYNSSDPHTWVNVPSDVIPPYESIVGVPVRGIPGTRAGNGSMMVQSSYISVSCGPWINGTSWLQKNISQLILAGPLEAQEMIKVNWGNDSFFSAVREGRENTFGPTYIAPPIQFDLLKDEFLNATLQMGGNFSLSNGEDRPSKQTLVFVANSIGKTFNDFLWDMTMCAPSTSYVDTMVRCSRSSDFGYLACSAERIRHSKGRPIQANATVFSFPKNLPVLSMIPRLLPDPEGGQNNMLNLFLRDPTLARPISAFYNYMAYFSPPSLEKVSMPIFEARLAAILNTVIRASFEQSIIVGADGLSPSTQMIIDNATGSIVTPLADWDNSTGTWLEFSDQVYKVNWMWMGVYVISTLVMTVFALGHLALQCKTKSPDFLSSVSTLMRDSPYVAVPDGGSALSGIERVRLLKDKWVRIQDVQPRSDVGRIAFSDMAHSEALSWDRRYH
ncbi:hypothetical protein BKA56DRAFT_663254 [Ilyonectria sp. MPI-CAGE-AT-0026]|nr:hypothetical protein BKA56DRAFT_663254 [Ilyonectria sp. MPI-CAGE-AT-0026]